MAWCAQLPPGCVVAMESCGGAHHWARRLATIGLQPRLIAGHFVGPYRMQGKRGKNSPCIDFGMKQQTLAMAADENAQYEQYRRPTKRDVFLATMEQIVPWAELCSVIEPHYPKAGNVHDKHPLPDLLHGQEKQVWGDCAYASQQTLISAAAPAAQDLANRLVRKGSVTEALERLVNRAKPRVRARVEHVFAVVKRLWGFNKVRYRGLAKNANRAFVATALANLFLARKHLVA